MEDQLQIYLCAREADLSQAWKMYCGRFPFVTVTKQDIMHIEAEAIVSPANSFGFMTGGIDLHYKNYFGQEVEDALRSRIALEFDHELCIGQATSVEITKSYTTYKYLIAAPTMRVPENVSHTINAFLAAKAALIEAKKIGVQSIVFPGLGTGTGALAPTECARQVAAAISYVLIDGTAYSGPSGLYEEQYHMRQHIVPAKWFEVQRMGE